MTTIHFDTPPARSPALPVSLLAWLWPEPLRSKRRRGGVLWWFASVAAIWPGPLQRDFTRAKPMGQGGRHSNRSLDRFLSRWWRVSWLWAWMWPGRLLGPDGEICPLVPWHPALQAQVCDVEPGRRRRVRRGMLAGMMMFAAALAAPTLMEGDSVLDGGRLSAFLGGGGAAEAGSGGTGGQGSGSGAGDPGAGPGPGQTGPLATFNPGNLIPPETQNSGLDSGQPPLSGGGTGSGDGAGSGEGAGPTGGEGGSEGGLTFLDSPTGGGAGVGDGLGFGFGGGSGGGGGGAGSGGIGGGGGGGGVGGGPGPGGGDLPTGPGEETPRSGGDDPFGPPDAPDDPFEMPKDSPAPPAGSPGGPAGPFGGGGIPLFDGPQGGGGGPLDAPLAPVPEPQTWAMMILGFGAVGYLIRRRRARSHVHA